ncbi:MAG TPA: MBL fold metallo-hydrolase, partial [Pseudacidobacterium sp.]|nr:MBL fold metallo-hydrolase [Pseudacidobacterium sp.]
MQGNLIILGSGTSMGVPTLGCDCRVCTSPDPRDRRTRPSIAIQWNHHCVLIDTGPDFRAQAMRENIRHIDAVLYTHAHADHILGLDDLRPLTFHHPSGHVPLYADDVSARVIEKVFDYTFSAESKYPTRARVKMNRLEGTDSVEIQGAKFQRIPLIHGETEAAGFRFGNAAYLTDMNIIPDVSLPLLDNLDVVIIDALRKTPHP